MGRDLHQVDDLPDQTPEVEGGLFEMHLAGLDLGEIEDVVEYPEQGLGRGLDLLHIVALLRVQGGAQGQLGHPDDPGHGGADLMAHIGQEFTLGVVGGLGGRPRLIQLLLIQLAPGDVAGQHDELPAGARLHTHRGDRQLEPGFPLRQPE